MINEHPLVDRLRSPLSYGNGPSDYYRWMKEAADEIERLKALVGRMLPYVQRWDAANPAETQVQITLEDDAERALVAHAHEPCEQLEEVVPHGVIFDHLGWACSICGGWNHARDKLCTHTHPIEGAPRGAGSESSDGK